MSSLVAGTGVTVDNNSGEGATPTVSIGQAVSTTSNVTFNDVTVSGNLTVSGTTTTINTETLNIADNIVTLNSDFTTGSPTQNAGIEVLRGSSATVNVRWNETNDKWELTNDGSNYGNIVTTNDTATVTNTMLAGSIANNKLTNSSVTIGSTSISLGATQTTITGLQNITTGSVYSNSVLLQRGGMGTYGYIQWETNNNSVAQLNWNPTASQSITIPNLSAFDSKYLAVTSSSSGLISANDLTGTTLNSTVITSSLTSVDTIGSGVWQGTAVAIAYGGTGSTTASGARTALGLAIGTDVQAYSSTLAAVAGGTYTGATSITTLGTIASGTWQGSTISSTYLTSGSTSAAGVLQLSDSTTSTSTSLAATANSVRQAARDNLTRFYMEVI